MKGNRDSKPVVAVVGASGFVGSACAEELADVAHVRRVAAPRIITASRTVSDLKESVAHSEIDTFAAESLIGADVVVNAAGIADATGSDLPAMLGANAVLPLFLARAAAEAGASRFVHISSAAVQGRGKLDESERLSPENYYALSKALGEILLREETAVEIVRYRPTSVQGPSRNVTRALIRLAESPLAVVAAPGSMPSPQVPIGRVARAVGVLSDRGERPPPIVLHPWEGIGTAQLLSELGGREPRQIARGLANGVVQSAYLLARGHRSALGHARRVDMVLFGQEQIPGWLAARQWRLGELSEGWLARIRQVVSDSESGG